MEEKKTPQWCLGWIAGFAAAASLMAGNKAFYERGRDEYLKRKGWVPPAQPQKS